LVGQGNQEIRDSNKAVDKLLFAGRFRVGQLSLGEPLPFAANRLSIGRPIRDRNQHASTGCSHPPVNFEI
jgi:hypothetical protein